jgi:3-deoxy-D-manno-octulosonic-acid transferase
MLHELITIISFLIYDIVFLLGFLFYLPMYIWRRKINITALGEKLGFIERTDNGKTIWIQVVSVGEVNAIGALIKELRQTYSYPIVITTTTTTGNMVAKEKYAHLAKVFFFPLDISCILKKVIRIINPKMFIAVETEIWPNLFRSLYKNDIPTAIINGRISDRAFKRYILIRPIIREVLEKCSFISAQNKLYKQRFISLGASEKNVVIGGNMKFGSISTKEVLLESIKNTYLPKLKKQEDILLLAACTHSPEEEIITNIYKYMFEEFREVKLLIAPRHPERTPQIEKIIQSQGFIPVRLSKIETSRLGEHDIFILDQIGSLIYFYALSDICFVGGSLSSNGGHNILEPIFFLKPTIFGPHMENFHDIEEIVLDKGAGIKIRDAAELKEIILQLVKDERLRHNLGTRCREVFEQETKSVESNIKIISEYL